MNSKLPFLVSVPHAGERVPQEVRDLCILNKKQIVADGDGGASEIYAVEEHVKHWVTTDIARSIVDLNRSPDDRGTDGVVKTHTCWLEPVYRVFPGEGTIAALLEKYYFPYHEALKRLASSGVVVGVDCHTMSEKAPPIGPDPGAERPWICLSNGDGTCPDPWLESLGRCFEEEFGNHVKLNDPFKGGYIVRTHSKELPWVQLEISRAPFLSNGEKGARILSALQRWYSTAFLIKK